MKYLDRLLWAVFFAVLLAFTMPDVYAVNHCFWMQDNIKLHTVEKGETLFSICKKYNMEQRDLLQLNPQLIFGLKAGEQIKVKPQFNEETKSVTLTESDIFAESDEWYFYLVKAKETVYSISKKTAIPIEVIYRFNPESEKELLENEVIRLPKKFEKIVKGEMVKEDDAFYYYKLGTGQGIYSLAKEYGAAITDVYEANKTLGNAFDPGDIIRIPKKPFEQQKVDTVYAEIPYFMHRIEIGDYYYAYKRKYGVTEHELKEMNPVLNEVGLLAGIEIKIPVKQELVKALEPKDTLIDQSNFLMHEVVEGETLWSLSKLYDVKVREIKELNPVLLSRGLLAGEQVMIKRIVPVEVIPENKTVEQELVVQTDTVLSGNLSFGDDSLRVFMSDSLVRPNLTYRYTQRDDTLKVALLLPLYLLANDTMNKELVVASDSLADSLAFDGGATEESMLPVSNVDSTAILDSLLAEPDSFRCIENRSLYPRSRNFVYFYEGFLLAVDSLQKAGVNVKLHVFDTANDTLMVDSLVKQGRLDSMDLIVGPVYDRNQKSVNELSKNIGIPMISPLSSNVMHVVDNPYYFQIAPAKDYIERKTADFIGDEFFDKNFIMLSMDSPLPDDEEQMVNLVKNKFYSTGYYNPDAGVLYRELNFVDEKYWGLKRILKTDKENVIFVPDSREAKIHIAVSNLVTLSKNFPITLVGLNSYERFRSIGVEYYHQLNLHFMTPYFIDYGMPGVNRFVKQFRSEFFSEPNPYSFQGFDVGIYFIAALNELEDRFIDEVEEFRFDVNQATYHFRKVSETGGFMNHALYLKNYTKEFDVKVIGTVSEGYGGL